MLRLAHRHHLYSAVRGVAANARNDGGYVVPKLSKSTPGHLLMGSI
jgi:hypothetical protein